MNPFKKTYKIPIYGAIVHLCISDNLPKQRIEYNNIFGEIEWVEDESVAGLCSWLGLEFGVFLQNNYLDIELIAHELFHLTHRIISATNSYFEIDNHEQWALLNGYLSKIIIPDIIKIFPKIYQSELRTKKTKKVVDIKK